MTNFELFLLKIFITLVCSFIGVLVMIRSHNKRIKNAERAFELTLKCRGMSSEVEHKEEV